MFDDPTPQTQGDRPRVLYLEPYEAGSHAAFTRTLTTGLAADVDWTVLTLPGRHWKWRMRGSALWFAQAEAATLARPHDLLFASSFLPLHELIGLRPALASLPKILYFHENQLAYPVRAEYSGERDVHFGFSQLLAALAADCCVFNSAHNRDSFLGAAGALLARLPDAVPPRLVEQVAARSRVLPLPLSLAPLDEAATLPDPPPGPARAAGPLLLWPHRWEHDKGPETLFAALRRLVEREVPFRLAVCGQRFAREPDVFAEARQWLGERVVQWGRVESPAGYGALLGQAQLALSTAQHEFFGVAMLEATHAGARPLVPARLAYPELFPAEFRYDDEELAEVLESLCRRWCAGELALRADRRTLTEPLTAPVVLPRYRALLQELLRGRPAPGAAGA